MNTQNKTFNSELSEIFDNNKLLDLFEAYNLEFEVNRIVENSAELTPTIDEEQFDSYDVPLNEEGKISDEVMIDLAQRLANDFDFCERLTYYNEKNWYDRLLMNDIEDELLEIEKKLQDLETELKTNQKYYLDDKANSDFEAQVLSEQRENMEYEVAYLIENFFDCELTVEQQDNWTAFAREKLNEYNIDLHKAINDENYRIESTSKIVEEFMKKYGIELYDQLDDELDDETVVEQVEKSKISKPRKQR